LHYFCLKQSIPSYDYPILHALKKFNYSPLNSKAILKSLESENPQPLDLIFDFNSFPISLFLQISQTVNNQADFTKGLESDFLYPWFFRGILVVSYYLKDEIQLCVRDQKMHHFPAEVWVLIQFSLKFLLSESKG
jgi:hypothetical protein